MANSRKISIFMLVLAIVSLALMIKQCSHSKQLQSDAESMQNFYEAEKNQLIERDSLRIHELIDMKQNLMSEVSARILLEKEFERFKSINSHTRFESVTKIETLYVEYQTPNTDVLADYSGYIPVDTVKKYFLQVPRDLKHAEDWFKFYGSVDKDHFMIDSMSFINKFDVTIGMKKSDKPLAFMRKKVPTVELVSYNPYTSVNYVNNVVIEDDKKNMSFPTGVLLGAGSTFLILKLIK